MGKCIILTEGSRSIGIGHITRSISLYQALENQGFSPEILVSGDDIVHQLLKNVRYELVDWINSRDTVRSAFSQADIAVVDSYLAGHEVYERLSRIVRVAVYVDDNNRIDYPIGVVANGSIGADNLNYKRKQGVSYLLGCKYVPLRKEFWNVPERLANNKIGNVLVTFGGEDIRNLTPGVLRLLVEKYPSIQKKVVIGSGYLAVDEITKRGDSLTEFVCSPGEREMKELMNEADFAVSAGGQTLYELARVGVPTIAVMVADNQAVNIKGWREAGFIIYAGSWQDKGIFENISRAMEDIRDVNARVRMSRVGREQVDGKGGMRIVQFVTENYSNGNPFPDKQ